MVGDQTDFCFKRIKFGNHGDNIGGRLWMVNALCADVYARAKSVLLGMTQNSSPLTDLTETTLSSETVYQGRLLQVKCDRVALPNGGESTREYIVHPGAVVILPVFENGDVLLERQHRYPLHRDFIEFPAGKIDAGEDDLTCGKRELREETGYEARDWLHVTTLYPCIGYANERLEFYCARDLVHVGHQRDADEFL